jgi:hypothetical protein
VLLLVLTTCEQHGDGDQQQHLPVHVDRASWPV